MQVQSEGLSRPWKTQHSGDQECWTRDRTGASADPGQVVVQDRPLRLPAQFCPASDLVFGQSAFYRMRTGSMKLRKFSVARFQVCLQLIK